MSRDFAGKVVLVTGGTSGIGLSLARAFAAAGAIVAICARNADNLSTVSSEFGRALAIPCDIVDPVQVDAMLATIDKTYGRIDILINNAGALAEHDFVKGKIGYATIAADLALNLVAPIALTDAALPLLRNSKAPAIVFIGSGFGWSPAARAPLYSAAKAGIRSFAKALRMQLQPAGVTVVEVVPPAVETPATKHREVKKISPDEIADRTLDGLRRSSKTVFAGQTRLLPLMLRLAPSFLERLVGRS